MEVDIPGPQTNRIPVNMKFFVGLHNVFQCKHFERSFVSVNRLRDRKSDFEANDWIMDSGAFTELNNHGRYRDEPDAYAKQVVRWSKCGNMLAAVSQDWMCEPFVLEKTGLSVREHQSLTIERYDATVPLCNGVYIMPVLQGYEPEEYVNHIRMYGDRIVDDGWVGVGSVCKRNSNYKTIESVLRAIKDFRPSLRLHGFGLKISALRSKFVCDSLYSSDSMAWSFAARREGRDANCWREAMKYSNRVNSIIHSHISTQTERK